MNQLGIHFKPETTGALYEYFLWHFFHEIAHNRISNETDLYRKGVIQLLKGLFTLYFTHDELN